MDSKKRKFGSSSLQQRKDGFWLYHTYTYYNTTDGKKKPLSKYLGKLSKTLLNQKRKDWDDHFDEIDEHYKGQQHPFSKPTKPINTIVDYWISECEKRVRLNDMSESTLRFNRENINLFRKWYLKECGNKLIHRVLTSEISPKQKSL